MARITLNSPNTAVFIGDSPAFKTTNETGTLFAGVQNASFSLPQSRQTQKQIGSCDYAVDDFVRHPDIDLSISYLFSPTLANENLLGLNAYNLKGESVSESGSFVSGLNDRSYNFYFYNHPKENFSSIKYINSSDVNTPNNGELICFGNAYLTDYSLSFANGALPVTSTTFKCSNMKGELYSGSISSPAINLSAGDNLSVGGFDLRDVKTTSEFEVDLTDPVLSNPGDLSIGLENLQVGGQIISGSNHILQSMAIQLPVNRVDLHGLGSDYVRGRKMQCPVRGNLSIASLVSKYEAGFISGLLRDEQTYSFDVLAKSCDGDVYGSFDFNSLKLETFDYSMTVNDKMQYSASFSFVMDDKGFNNSAGMLASFFAGGTPYYTTAYGQNGEVITNDFGNPIEEDIPNNWMLNNVDIYSVKIGSTCSLIGNYSFQNSINLGGDLVIPNSVTSIGISAFENCGISSITMGNSVSIINGNAFKDCSSVSFIRMFRETPPDFGGTPFLGVPISIPLYVPNGASANYNVSPWNSFIITEDPA